MMDTDELDTDVAAWEAEEAARRVERYQTAMLVAKLRHAAALLSEINDEYEGLRFNWNPYGLTAEAEYLESRNK